MTAAPFVFVPSRRLRMALALVLVAAAPGLAAADTGPDLSSRIVIDGFPREYTDGEAIFGIKPGTDLPEESTFDSKWGPDNDLNNIRITWDAESLYVAGTGVTWGNNMLIWFDTVPGRGMADMQELNSWRRGFVFSDDFRPDLFLATWDGNTTPRLLIHQGGTQVDDQQVGDLFRGAATFSQNLRGRSMEYAIPWNTFFLGSEGLGTTPRFVPSRGETLQTFPTAWGRIKVAAAITAGADGTGGPDSAPDNTRGHVTDGGQVVVIDNYAIVDLDRNDDTGTGGGGPDGVADWGVRPIDRVSFKFQPPLEEVRLEVGNVEFDRPAFAPHLDQRIRFTFEVLPELDPADPVNQGRTLNLTASVYDLRGRKMRDLYVNEQRQAIDPADPGADLWDGRDANGALVPAGVYVLRLVLEPDVSRIKKSFVVVR